MTKFKNLNFDKTKKTQIVTKLKNLNCDKTKQLKLWQEEKEEEKNCDKTQNLKLWQNSKTPIVTIQILNLWQLKNSVSDNSKTLIVTKPKLWENSKTQVVPRHKNSNCD